MPDRNIKITLQYDGSRYDGWQKQGNTDKTIQGKLEQILEKMAGQTVEVHGSGRTDAGVHAWGQVANFHTESDMSTEEIMAYCNRYLPEDIRVIDAKEVPERFHSRLSAVRKTYAYYVETADRKCVFERKYVYGLGRELDIPAMEKAAGYLLGEHDFKSFCSNKRMKKSTVRRMDQIGIHTDGTKVVFTYTGNGFLYNMIRILVGTLLSVSEGELSVSEIPEILAARNRIYAGRTVQPYGLYLHEVFYEDAAYRLPQGDAFFGSAVSGGERNGK